MQNSERVGPGIVAIDTGQVRPGMAASHLLTDGAQAAFVDVGSNASVPRLLAALAAEGLDPAQVRWVILTHIHLDHAGGTGRLLQQLPQAQVLVHPRGRDHLIDPSKLESATRAVYGRAQAERMYGTLEPVPADRVVALEEGSHVALGARRLHCLHTPGHALHHLCLWEPDTGSLFTGDTFGIRYREFDTERGAFVFATTTPTQFDPAQLHASIDRLLALGARAAYLTHYSRLEPLDRAAHDLHADIDCFVAIARANRGATRMGALPSALFDYLAQRLDDHGFQAPAARMHELLDMDVQLNAAGLEAWLKRGAR